jgi:hypothetical protein
VHVNVVGGYRVDPAETGLDLPLLAAVASSYLDAPLPERVLLIGEVGLRGELRHAPNMEVAGGGGGEEGGRGGLRGGKWGEGGGRCGGLRRARAGHPPRRWRPQAHAASAAECHPSAPPPSAPDAPKRTHAPPPPPQLRLLEAAKLRYDAAIVPAASRVSLTPEELGGMRLLPARSLGGALAEVFGEGVLPAAARRRRAPSRAGGEGGSGGGGEAGGGGARRGRRRAGGGGSQSEG